MIDIECEAKQIVNAYNYTKQNTEKIINPYYVEKSRYKYYRKTMEILQLINTSPQSMLKTFYDFGYSDYSL